MLVFIFSMVIPLIFFLEIIIVITAVRVIDTIIDPRDPSTFIPGAEVREIEQSIVMIGGSGQNVGDIENKGF